MMKILKSSFFFAILLIFNNHSQGSLIEIKVKIQNKIITNKDIESESKYLLFLNPKLKELDISKVNEIAKNSLIREKVKRKGRLLIFSPKSFRSDFYPKIFSSRGL